MSSTEDRNDQETGLDGRLATTRRQFLRQAMGMMGGAALAQILAACGSQAPAGSAAATAAPVPTAAASVAPAAPAPTAQEADRHQDRVGRSGLLRLVPEGGKRRADQGRRVRRLCA